MAKSHFLAVAAALVVLAVAVPSKAPAPLPEGMLGKWEGVATVIVVGSGISVLKVSMVIRADRTAEGTVGDTDFRGTVKDQRWYRGADYVVEGNLLGAIIEAQNVRPPGVVISLNWDGKQLTGSVDTIGQVDASQRVKAEKLVLTRVKG